MTSPLHWLMISWAMAASSDCVYPWWNYRYRSSHSLCSPCSSVKLKSSVLVLELPPYHWKPIYEILVSDCGASSHLLPYHFHQHHLYPLPPMTENYHVRASVRLRYFLTTWTIAAVSTTWPVAFFPLAVSAEVPPSLGDDTPLLSLTHCAQLSQPASLRTTLLVPLVFQISLVSLHLSFSALHSITPAFRAYYIAYQLRAFPFLMDVSVPS
mmetsp:Transcript_31717/g.47550  ORF Transcript_31717/g.47550 Transcript_31717/m.47550 type:complete len:211 (-) Transcript_31717:380-1012(-)